MTASAVQRRPTRQCGCCGELGRLIGVLSLNDGLVVKNDFSAAAIYDPYQIICSRCRFVAIHRASDTPLVQVQSRMSGGSSRCSRV